MSDPNQKKPFDSTVCFTFFGSWVESIEAFEVDADKSSTAYTLFKAIAEYSLYGNEPDFDAVDQSARVGLNALWKVLCVEIDNSVDRRKRGFATEGPTAKQQAVIQERINNPSATQREIAHVTGVSKSNVGITMKKYKALIDAGLAKKEKLQANIVYVASPEITNTAEKETCGAATLRQEENPFGVSNDDDGELPF